MSDKQAEYLRLLQERNRLKKQMNAKSKEQLAMEELEKGFNTHFRTTQMQRTTAVGSAAAPPSILVANANTAIPLSVIATQPRGAAAKEKELSPEREGGSKSVKSWRGNKGWGPHLNAGFHAMKQADSDGDKAYDLTALGEDTDGDKHRGETDEYESDFDDHDSEAAVVLQQRGKQQLEQEQEQEQQIKGQGKGPPDDDVEEVDMDMDQSLVQRISSLGAQQKQRLLSLLLHESGLEKAGVGPMDSPVLVPVSVSGPVPDLVSVTAPGPAAVPVFVPVPVSFSLPGPRPSCVKLRILTCRDNAKMVSLRALRLRLVLPAGEFDVLPLCQLRLSSGLLPVAAALDASRLLPMLACGPDLPVADEEAGLRRVRAVSVDLLRRQASRGTWKAALSSSAPLEIRMDLPPPERLWEIVQKAGLLPSDGQRRLYESMRLLLWNGSYGSSGCGGARDVDVYLDSSCVFSGELPAPAPEEDLPGPSELPPAVAVQLAGASSIAAAPVTKTQAPAAAPFPAAATAATSGSPASDQDSDPPARPPAILPRPFESRVRGEDNLWGQDQVADKDKPRPRRGRPSRRDRGGLQSVAEAEDGAEEIITAEDLGVGMGMGRGRGSAAAGEREQRVRQSLEAIQQAERFNLGRLRKGSRMACPELTAGADSLATAVGLDPARPSFATAQDRHRDGDRDRAREREDDVILDDSLEQTANSMEPVAEKASVSSIGEEARSLSERTGSVASTAVEGRAVASQRQQQQQRSHRIEKVQETILNTIADLNDIMSSLAIAKTSARDRDSKPTSRPFAATSFPSGQILVLEILSTWGDSNYVGLNGIEIFDHCGRLCSWAAGGAKDRDRDRDRSGREAEQRSRCVAGVHSFPRDINCLAQFQDSNARDPRSAANLLDGHNFTRSDMHVWLAPHRRTLLEEQGRPAEGSSDGSGGGEEAQAASAAEDSEALALLRTHGGGAQSLAEDVLAVVVVQLTAPTQLSMVRVFNYNKSRTHNQRGVRCCRLLLDGQLLFDGELRRASGQLLSLESESDVIELCADQLALKTARLLSDRINSRKQVEEDVLEESVLTLANLQRPRTSQAAADDRGAAPAGIAAAELRTAAAAAAVDADTPNLADSMSGSFSSILQEFAGLDLASADHSVGPRAAVGAGAGVKAAAMPAVPVSIPAPPAAALSSSGCSDSLLVHTLRLDLLSTWGDGSYVGLCGLQLLGSDAKGALLPLDPTQLKMTIDAQPRDLSSVGCFDDPRVLPNLLDGCNDTVDERRMWLIPFSGGGEHFLQLKLGGQGVRLVGIRIWNYNKGGSHEHLLRGCKEALLSVDGKPIKRCLLRMGPGCPGIKYQQDILLMDHLLPLPAAWTATGSGSGSGSGSGLRSYISPSVRQDYEPPHYLVGLLFKFTFFDNWNDGYYLGLDRLEFLDARGEAVDLTQVAAVDAVPHSLRDVIAEGDVMADDPRTPQQLLADLTQLQTHNRTLTQMPSWLCPLSRCMTHQEKVRLLRRSVVGPGQGEEADLESSLPANNTLFVLFREPQHVAGIRFFNYSKTPARGVRDFSVEADGRLCFMGSLLPADKEKQHTFVASRLGSRPPAAQPRCSSRGQVVLFTNDPKVTAAQKDLVSYCGSTEQDVLYINERQVMVRSKSMYNDCNPNPNLEGVQCDFSKRPMTGFVSS